MKHLRFCAYGAEEAGIHKHPQLAMQDLGITFVMATPQSMAGQWWFWGCSGNIDQLPGYLTPLGLEPHACVGWGLSTHDVQIIEEAVAKGETK